MSQKQYLTDYTVTVVLLFTGGKGCRDLLNCVQGQVFNDSALPTPDVEMLNILRGTGIQVELHEVKLMIAKVGNTVLEGCYGIPPRR